MTSENGKRDNQGCNVENILILRVLGDIVEILISIIIDNTVT